MCWFEDRRINIDVIIYKLRIDYFDSDFFRDVYIYVSIYVYDFVDLSEFLLCLVVGFCCLWII